MNNIELLRCLCTLRLTPKEAADLLSVDPKTVMRWVTGAGEISGPAKQAIRAWLRLDKMGMPWRPSDHSIGLTEEEAANQIRLMREHNMGLANMIARVRARGGPAAPWKVDLKRHVAELGDIMEVSFYPLPNGGFSPSTYRRKDRETDYERDRLLLEDAFVSIADEIAAKGHNWQGEE